MVEQATHNRLVTGSFPVRATKFPNMLGSVRFISVDLLGQEKDFTSQQVGIVRPSD